MNRPLYPNGEECGDDARTAMSNANYGADQAAMKLARTALQTLDPSAIATALKALAERIRPMGKVSGKQG